MIRRMQILLYIGIFYGGLFAGYMLRQLVLSMKSFDGVMRVIKDEDKTVYSLELHGDPNELAFKPEVIFKVVTDLKINSDRK